MRIISLCIATVIVGSIASCGFKANEDVPAAENPSTIPSKTAGVSDSSSLAAALSGNKIPAGAVTPNTTTTPATTATTSTNSSAALNPAHGQPGHRCDIAVGAPLNSAPTVISAPATNNAATTTTNPPTTTNPIPAATTTSQPAKTGAGLNPAHGQPGHRCDIAVGAPLDSKPTTAATTTTSPANNTPTIIQGSSPVNPNAQKSTVSPIPVSPIATAPTQSAPTTAAGMNPAHGQPGHRCDIAVGAPLNSKPTTTKQ